MLILIMNVDTRGCVIVVNNLGGSFLPPAVSILYPDCYISEPHEDVTLDEGFVALVGLSQIFIVRIGPIFPVYLGTSGAHGCNGSFGPYWGRAVYVDTNLYPDYAYLGTTRFVVVPGFEVATWQEYDPYGYYPHWRITGSNVTCHGSLANPDDRPCPGFPVDHGCINTNPYDFSDEWDNYDPNNDFNITVGVSVDGTTDQDLVFPIPWVDGNTTTVTIPIGFDSIPEVGVDLTNLKFIARGIGILMITMWMVSRVKRTIKQW